MCNLYSQTKSQEAMHQVFRDVLEEDEELIDTAGNLAPDSGIFPDYAAPIIRRSKGRDWTLTTDRWGIPTPPVYLAGKHTDPGVTNIRNVSSPHWRRWLGAEHRCLVPFTSFSELDARPAAQQPGLVRTWLGSTTRVLCRDPHRMDFGQKAEEGRGNSSALRISDL
ncbi:SOS response-associated peptidase family protein [Gemmobacter sp. 24YEA27]|uniref:SOS response-associated peptidase family protein n=1 Tax=Gemmobacter sp. 24YEA27 TaxID=3040672 RepID=UPI0024B3C322|nr:SOS response-associated peptidase family protein [Gemmobacter sp. 24YEA27]